MKFWDEAGVFNGRSHLVSAAELLAVHVAYKSDGEVMFLPRSGILGRRGYFRLKLQFILNSLLLAELSTAQLTSLPRLCVFAIVSLLRGLVALLIGNDSVVFLAR